MSKLSTQKTPAPMKSGAAVCTKMSKQTMPTFSKGEKRKGFD